MILEQAINVVRVLRDRADEIDRQRNAPAPSIFLLMMGKAIAQTYREHALELEQTACQDNDRSDPAAMTVAQYFQTLPPDVRSHALIVFGGLEILRTRERKRLLWVLLNGRSEP